VLFARGDGQPNATEVFAPTSEIIVYLDPAYNDVLVAFRAPKPNADQSSATYFTDNYCIFSVDNVPLYRWTVFHIVYDSTAQNARFYVDGKLRKVFNLFSCSAVAVSHTSNQYSWGKVMSSDNTYSNTSFSAPAAPGIIAKYSLIARTNSLLSGAQVEQDAALKLKNVAAQQANVNSSQLDTGNTCPPRGM
jgi:hypothetical protein